MENKYVPLRTCIVTRTKKPKLELIRIVKKKEDNVEMLFVDVKSNLSGRGVYLLPDLEVFAEALKKGKIIYCLKLKRKLETEEITKLKKDFENKLTYMKALSSKG